MQKFVKLTIAILLVASITAQTGRLAGDRYVHAHKSIYPISEQSCSNTPSQSYGWFWDGQKCERCASDECICSSYNTCDSCLEGYVLVTDNDHPSGYCQKCPSFSEAPYKNNANFYPHDTAAWNLAGSAGLMIHSGNDDIVKTCCNPLGSVAAWDASTRMALRATSCIDGTLSGRKYIHLGSICWYMDGCNSYTSTGKCKSCNDGYYLDDNQICRMCRAQCLEKPNELNITVAQALSGTCTDGRTWHRPCTKCRSADQCDECVRGYYLAKSSHFDKQTSDTTWLPESLKDASWCRRCSINNNCHCTVAQGGNMTYEVISNAWYKTEANECKLCSDFAGQSLCATCNYEFASTASQTGKYTCLSCRKGKSSNNRWVTESVKDNTCMECDIGCFRCARFDNTTTTCRIGSETFCENGYRVQAINNTERISCTKCTDQDATRCKMLNDGTEQVTQCKSEGLSSNYETGVQGYHNRAPPNSQDFYLIAQSNSTKSKCVQNQFNCKTMKTGATDGLCTDCYPGYHKVNDQCIKCQTGRTNICKECALGQLDLGLQCASCFPRYTLDTRDQNKKTCIACPNNCAVCGFNNELGTTNGKCSQCDDGYFLNLTDTTINQCKKCVTENCKSCVKSPLECDLCKSTFRLWENKNEKVVRSAQFCEQCEYGCAVCTLERKQCSECSAGFYLWHGVCHKPKRNCVKMNGINCEVCAIGYRRVDSQCLQCFDLEGGFVHCHEGCDTSNTRWMTTVDSTWVNVNSSNSSTSSSGTGGNGSLLSFTLCSLIIAIILSFIM